MNCTLPLTLGKEKKVKNSNMIIGLLLINVLLVGEVNREGCV
jgi:hypothetical protein